MCLRNSTGLLLAAALWVSAGAGAVARSPLDPGAQQSVVALPLQDLPAGDSLFDRAGRMLGGLFGQLWTDRHGGDALPGRIPPRDDFVALMDEAGYGLREIDTSIGLIPGSRMVFGQARELTDADRDHLERRLERHALRESGPLSRIQRAIIAAVLAASDLGDLAVERVEIDLLPLPQVRMALVPRDAPVSFEAGRLLRSIDRLTERLQSAQAWHGETELQMRRREAPMRPAAMPVAH